MQLFPKTEDFFKLFEQQAEQVQKAAKLLDDIEHNGDMRKKAQKMKGIEHDADEVTHEIIRKLNQTFITPFDREDITLLSSHLDNVVDEIERAVNRIYIYGVNPKSVEIERYARLIIKAAGEIVKGVKELRNRKNCEKILKYSEIINLIENQADELHRDNLKQLFEKEKDAINILKLKEIYEALESVTDRCEDVANALESVVIKHL